MRSNLIIGFNRNLFRKKRKTKRVTERPINLGTSDRSNIAGSIRVKEANMPNKKILIIFLECSNYQTTLL